MSKPKRPSDLNQRAKSIVDIATGEITEPDPYKGKNPAAVTLGRLGGLKGGKARAAKLTVERIPPSKCMLSTALLEQVNPQNSEDYIFRERDHQALASTDCSGVRAPLSY